MGESPGAREVLLQQVVDEVARGGLADRSLRELAAAVGTSHRMLLYHFGSREGLVAAIVAHVEATQRELLQTFADETRDGDDPSTLVRRMWAQVSAPEVRPFVQLFFEAVAYASRAGGEGFTSAWLTDATTAAERAGVGYDPVDVRLGVAVMRGLLIDVITGDDPQAANLAFERFVAMWAAADAAPRARRKR